MKSHIICVIQICICINASSSPYFQSRLADTAKSDKMANFKPLKSYTGGLKVGDKLPELTISQIINYPSTSLKLSDFHGKKLLIDFWGTYCSTCLEKFPLTDSIQKEYREKFQVLLVDGIGKTETKERIFKALSRFNSPGKEPFSLPSAINDTILNKVFPHNGNPHYVWVDEFGIVKSIAGHEDMTRQKLIAFINSGNAPKIQKEDYNWYQPLYTVDFLPLDNLKYFSLLIKGFQDGIPVGNANRVINGKRRGLALMNFDLRTLYSKIGDALIPGFATDRLKIAVHDPSLIFYQGQTGEKIDWMRKNLYTYESILPEEQYDNYWSKMLSELNFNTAYTASLETRSEPCWSLEITGKGNFQALAGEEYLNTLGSGGEAKLTGASLFDLCTYIREEISKGTILLDHTGYKGLVNIKFKNSPKDFETLQEYLKPYGLQIKISNEPVELLVIRDRQPKPLNN